MNFPDYLRSIWTDPRFQALDTPVRALLYGALSQVDVVGWWAPNPRLVAAEIPGIDLKHAQDQLTPWVQVHPTGWWSFRGYVALQAGGDGALNLKSNFHKGMDRVLKVHAKREIAAGALPETIEGLEAPPTGGLEGSSQAGLGGNGGASVGQARASAGAESPKTQVQCPKSPSLQAESPTRGSGGDEPSPAPEASRYEDVVNLFVQFGQTGFAGVVDVKPWERDKLHKSAAKYGWNLVYRAATAYFTDGRHRGAPSLAECVDGLPRLISLACVHPEPKRTWWTMPVEAQYPKGLQRKHWRCELCGHHQAHGVEFLPSEHEHRYTQGEGSGLIVAANGQVVSVPAWEACSGPEGCGHRRALQGQEVAP